MDQVDHHKIHECQDSASFGPTLDRWRSYAVFVNCDFVVLSYSSQCCRFFLTLIEGLRKEDVVHCTDCKAHWGNVIVIWGFYGHQVCLAKANSAASLDTVVVQDLSLGEGQAVENGDSLEVVYTGWLLQNHVIGQVTRFFFYISVIILWPVPVDFLSIMPNNSTKHECHFRCLTRTRTRTSCYDWKLELEKWSKWVNT